MSLSAATRSETTKLFSTSMWWILALVLAVYIGSTAAALGFVYAAAASGSLPGDAPPLPEDGLAALLYSTATSVGYVFPLVIGTLMVTGEFRHKTLTPTFLATPRRGLVLWAKMLVGVLVGVLYGVIGIAVSVGASVGFLTGFDVDPELTSDDIWTQFGRMLLAYVLWVLIGIGVGALVRNQVGAIVGVLVFTQFIEPVGRLAAAFVDGLSDVTQYLPGAASDTLVGASVLAMSMSTGDTGGMEWWAGGLVLLGYAVVLVLLGHLFSWRRDVS